jgi:hypothetical protein
MQGDLKSYVRDLLELYANILADIAYANPNLVPDLSKDWDRLTSLVLCRGLRFLTVDLPALAKHLERCLANGQYIASGLPGSHRISRRVPIPELFGGLYLLVFTRDGRLKEDVDVSALFFLRQVLLAAKRTKLQCPEVYVREEICDFLKTDDALPVPAPFWRQDRIGCSSSVRGFAFEHRYVTAMFRLSKPEVPKEGENPPRADHCHLLTMLDKVVDIVATSLGPYRPEDWEFSHGPGAVSDKPKGENKYAFANWSDCLDSAFPFSECAFSSYSGWVNNFHTRRFGTKAEMPHSKLVAVPKTFVKPRLIASEPSEHMWCQQNVKHYMYERTASSWIREFVNFTDQERNQQLALLGSMDGSLATVDLSSASDRVSCMCVENTFKRNPLLLDALCASRTRRCLISQDGFEDRIIEIKKYSTMGNATTFPVETLIFLSVALTATLWQQGHREVSLAKIRQLAGSVTVFGDDIVVPTNAVRALTLLLEVLDFKVNSSKTFSAGKFRESCGVDAFAGQNITPAYYKGIVSEDPESIVSRVEASNNFYQRLLVRTSCWLASTLPSWVRPLMVPMDSGVFGLKSFVRPRVPTDRKIRWNEQLQRTEHSLNLPVGRIERAPIEDESALLQLFTEQTEPLTCTTGIGRAWMHGEASRPQNGVVVATATKFSRRWVDLSVVHWQEDPIRANAVKFD